MKPIEKIPEAITLKPELDESEYVDREKLYVGEVFRTLRHKINEIVEAINSLGLVVKKIDDLHFTGEE